MKRISGIEKYQILSGGKRHSLVHGVVKSLVGRRVDARPRYAGVDGEL